MDEETKSVEEPGKGKDEFAKVERKLRKLEKQEKWANRKLFQKKDIPLNYRTFAEDLYTLQFPEGRAKIGLKWSQDLYRNNKEDKDNE